MRRREEGVRRREEGARRRPYRNNVFVFTAMFQDFSWVYRYVSGHLHVFRTVLYKDLVYRYFSGHFLYFSGRKAYSYNIFSELFFRKFAEFRSKSCGIKSGRRRPPSKVNNKRDIIALVTLL